MKACIALTTRSYHDVAPSNELERNFLTFESVLRGEWCARRRFSNLKSPILHAVSTVSIGDEQRENSLALGDPTLCARFIRAFENVQI